MPIELPPGTASYSDRNPPPQNRQILVILGGIAGLVVLIIWLLNLFVSGLIGLIPPSVERQLGSFIVPAFEQLSQPSPTQDTLNQLLDRLEAKLPDEQRQDHHYQVLYIPEPTINAIAIPGDRIIIFSGLLANVKSENELMMVLGHELGHFAHRDHLQRLGRGIVLRFTLASLLGDPSAIQSIAVSGITAVSTARFSQQQEFQADDFGLQLLQSTYGHVTGATDFFARLSQQERGQVDFLATHPNSRKRVKRLEAEIKEQAYASGTRSPLPPTLVEQTATPSA
ncbi:M48 family metallopeptidase [Oculatella sp. LEGE 06141]|uniref:M48 family metallopeptidase n=1 Tax=Oculatella sp. LEGE 06141 TaxID=1828648 RepID=UPI001881C964|nr:M48 family metallopeptidase [Oculatella sp. LEGE 06141]MBE9179979.1 M48 family metallopeptidase [Oculatella sp. LEGE 06141]